MGWSECSSDAEESNTTYRPPPHPSRVFRSQNSSSSHDIIGSTGTSTNLARKLYDGRASRDIQIPSPLSLPKKQHQHTKRSSCERGNGTEKYEPVVTFEIEKNVTAAVGEDNEGRYKEDTSVPIEVHPILYTFNVALF